LIVTGLHAVEEAVRADPRRIEWVIFDEARRDRRSGEIKRLCRERGVSIRYGRREQLDRFGARHQGVAARLAAAPAADRESLLSGPAGTRLLLVLDEIQDPHNLGAILRVAEGAGARVVVPERGSAPVSETVARVSAGAVERVCLFRAGNLRRFLDDLRETSFRVVGLDERGDSLYEKDLTGDLALVLGSEGKGLRRLVREGCDELARIPMEGQIASLNVSTAAAVAAFEAARQRRKGACAS
jgi:23S rRNA (guanosine2251-2'-O)-methyltransferase